MQSKDEIEKTYQKPDPWGYQSSPEDSKRKHYILHLLDIFGPHYRKALDIGAGEGWITQHLRAAEIHAMEISDTAASRFPGGIRRVSVPDGRYDLVTAMGVLYNHYDFLFFKKCIQEHASGIVLVSYIAAWEHPWARNLPGKELLLAEFPYNEHRQRVRIVDVSAS